MEIGDIVILKEDHWLRERLPGYCEIVEIKGVPFIMEFNINIMTLDSIDGSKTRVWVKESEIIAIVKIRNEKLKQILDEI